MKYLISESKINKVILDYISDEFTPSKDKYWGPELHKDHYKDHIDLHDALGFGLGSYESLMFAYYGEWDGYDYLYRLSLEPFVADKLTSLFGDLWKPIFIKWFEHNTGLEVKEFLIDP